MGKSKKHSGKKDKPRQPGGKPRSTSSKPRYTQTKADKQSRRTMRILLLSIAILASLLIIIQRASARSAVRGQLFLYGEVHGLDTHTNKLFYRWQYYYTFHGLRNLFLEAPVSYAGFLNIWMTESHDYTLEALFYDIRHTHGHTDAMKKFYQRIKHELPETIFHGIDIDVLYSTLGARFVEHLAFNGIIGTELNQSVLRNISQGRRFFSVYNLSHMARIRMMTENIVNALSELDGEGAMGILGVAHVAFDYYYSVLGGGATIAHRIRSETRINVTSTDLRQLIDGEPARISLAGTMYYASHHGKVLLVPTTAAPIVSFEYWRVYGAYEDLRGRPVTGHTWPVTPMPMLVDEGDIVVVLFTMTDGYEGMWYFRISGEREQGMEVATGFYLYPPGE